MNDIGKAACVAIGVHDGDIIFLTNYHVVHGAIGPVHIHINGKKLPSKVGCVNKKVDIAILRLPVSSMSQPPERLMVIARKKPKDGDKAIIQTIGKFQWTTIRQFNRGVDKNGSPWYGEYESGAWIFRGDVSRGMSGGAITDTRGRLVGLIKSNVRDEPGDCLCVGHPAIVEFLTRAIGGVPLWDQQDKLNVMETQPKKYVRSEESKLTAPKPVVVEKPKAKPPALTNWTPVENPAILDFLKEKPPTTVADPVLASPDVTEAVVDVPSADGELPKAKTVHRNQGLLMQFARRVGGWAVENPMSALALGTAASGGTLTVAGAVGYAAKKLLWPAATGWLARRRKKRKSNKSTEVGDTNNITDTLNLLNRTLSDLPQSLGPVVQHDGSTRVDNVNENNDSLMLRLTNEALDLAGRGKLTALNGPEVTGAIENYVSRNFTRIRTGVTDVTK